MDEQLRKIGLKPNDELTDSRVAWTWQTSAGVKDGTLLVGHIDVPLEQGAHAPQFRREPEALYGEGIGASRAPLVSMLFALRALRRTRQLRKLNLGVLYYADEGRDCRYSSELIAKATAEAKNVLVLRPGNPDNFIVTARRGQRRYRVTFDGAPVRMGKTTRRPEVLPWAFDKLQSCAKFSSKKDRISVATLDIKTNHMPMLLPHQVVATLLVSFPDEKTADTVEQRIRETLDEKGVKCRVELLSARPAMKERRATTRLAKAMESVAGEWEIPLRKESSVWPSVAGLAPASTGVLCGVGPVARNVYTPDESVDRISLMQRTLLLAEFLASQSQG